MEKNSLDSIRKELTENTDNTNNNTDEQGVLIKTMMYEKFDDDESNESEKNGNIGLVMSIPLDVNVEIGRCRKTVKEIADFDEGTVVELNKQLDEPVDLVVNGKLIAKGEVVVIGNSFGVRITEIVDTDIV